MSVTFCPSCAARIGEDIPAGESLKCPVCGTEFKSGSGESAESSIAKSDQPQQSLASGETRGQPVVRRQSTEEILLHRLESEPPEKPPIPWSRFALILVVILGVSFAIFTYSSKPDKFAPGEEVDSSAITAKHMFFQHIADSLQAKLHENASDTDAYLSLADANYDMAHWDESVHNFQTYLHLRPNDADARVDYSLALAQSTGDIEVSLRQIDSTLLIKPDHLNALINGGILSAQSIADSNHIEALDRSRHYFERAKSVAIKTDPAVAARIDTLLVEINKTGQRMVAKAPK